MSVQKTNEKYIRLIKSLDEQLHLPTGVALMKVYYKHNKDIKEHCGTIRDIFKIFTSNLKEMIPFLLDADPDKYLKMYCYRYGIEGVKAHLPEKEKVVVLGLLERSHRKGKKFVEKYLNLNDRPLDW